MLLSLTAQRPHVRSKWALLLWLEALTNSDFVFSSISFSHKKVSKTKWCAVSLTLVWSTWHWRIWEYLTSSVGHRQWPVSQQNRSFPLIPSSNWKKPRKGKCQNFGFLYTVSTQLFISTVRPKILAENCSEMYGIGWITILCAFIQNYCSVTHCTIDGTKYLFIPEYKKNFHLV